MPYDAINRLLPICNDNNDVGWRCSCGRATQEFTIDNNYVHVNEGACVKSADVSNAISIIDMNDIENFNSFALLGGVVDFNRIDNFSSVDQFDTKVLNIKHWSQCREFEKWKLLLQKNSSIYRRPKMFCSEFAFTTLKSMDLNKVGQSQWDGLPNDPIHETVFVSTSSLNNLLREADDGVFVVFLSPDNVLTTRRSVCHFEDKICEVYSEDFALNCTDNKNCHVYWKLRSACKQNSCIFK
jgi:hypothetical protein